MGSSVSIQVKYPPDGHFTAESLDIGKHTDGLFRVLCLVLT